jgi:uncharacterized protein (TIGR00730 family)
MLRKVCVFCGSNTGTQPVYMQAAREVGRLLSERKIGLVYGGANRGLMGALADACLESGGKVIGVMPRALVDKEITHRQLTKLYMVDSMHERKALIADLADAFLALPGGYGTWEEFFEVLTWSQLGLHRKACALLNVGGYYDCFLGMADRAVQDGFLRMPHRELMIADTDPSRLLDRLSECDVPVTDKWIDAGSR